MKCILFAAAFLVAVQLWPYVYGAEVNCTFKASGEEVELTISMDKKAIWDGRLRKSEEKSLRLPSGSVTVESRTYNENLNKQETVTASLHTDSCKLGVITVPVFSSP